MKKITLTTLFLATVLLSFSQKKSRKNTAATDTSSSAIHFAKEPRFMINIHGGYAFGMASTFKFYPDDISAITLNQDGTNPPAKTVAYSNPTTGLGHGFKFGFGASYIINDFINIGLDFDFLWSNIKKYRDSTCHLYNIPVPNPLVANKTYYAEHNTLSYDASLLCLTPNITFKAISRPKWFLYNKLGAIITIGPDAVQEDDTDIKTSMSWQGFHKDSSMRVEKKYEWEMNNPAFGFLGAIGAQVKIAEHIRIYAEAQFSHTVFVTHKRILTKYVMDNVHLENSFPVIMRELEFVKSFTSNSDNIDFNKPAQTIIQRIPIDYLGFQVGITLLIK